MKTIIEKSDSGIDWDSQEPFLVTLDSINPDVTLIVLVAADVNHYVNTREFKGTVIYEKNAKGREVGEFYNDFNKSLFTKFEGTITITQ